MKATDYKESVDTQDRDQPQPWDRQPGEPVDHYHWFKVYLTRPLPRKVAQVAKLSAPTLKGPGWPRSRASGAGRNEPRFSTPTRQSGSSSRPQCASSSCWKNSSKPSSKACSTQPGHRKRRNRPNGPRRSPAATSPRLRGTSSACSGSLRSRVSRSQKSLWKSSTKPALRRNWSTNGH